MAIVVTNPRQADSPSPWLWELLKEELAPYPGRIALVARMVTATTIVMIMTMTYRIPFGAYGAVYALSISRESPRMTAAEVKTTVFAFAAGAVYVLIGAIFFVDQPMVRVLWVIATFFVMFYALSVMADYVAAARFGYMMIITTPLWDQHLGANDRVEDTLWAVAAVGSASLITLLLELAFAQFGRRDEIVRSIAENLEAVEVLLADYGEDRPVAESAAKNVRRRYMVGTSRQRRYLDRSNRSPQYREQMGAVVALAGRLIDLAASLEYVDVTLDDKGRKRASDLAENLSSIRTAIVHGRIPQLVEPHCEGAEDSAPLFGEMEVTVGLIPKAFAGSEAITAYSPHATHEEQSRGFFVPDAFANPEHMQFGLKGCLAASLCYIAYNALFWPGKHGGHHMLPDCSDDRRRVPSEATFAHRGRGSGRLRIGHGSADLYSAVSRFDCRVHRFVRTRSCHIGLDHHIELAHLVFRVPDRRRFFPDQPVGIPNPDVARSSEGPRRGHSAGPFDDVAGVRPVVESPGRGTDEEDFCRQPAAAGSAHQRTRLGEPRRRNGSRHFASGDDPETVRQSEIAR